MSKTNPKTANNGSNQNTNNAAVVEKKVEQAAVESKQEDSAQDASQQEDKGSDTATEQSAPSVSKEAAAPVAVQESGEDRVITPSPSPVVVEKPVVVAEPEPAPAPKVEATAVVDSTVVVVDAVAPVSKNAELKTKLASILRSVPETHHGDITRVLSYLEAMAPKRPINPKDGAKEQVALYRSIQNIINRQEEHFTPLFSALLHIFKSEFNGALGDRYRLRFLESIELGAGDRKAFQKITHLLHITADPVSRERALKTIDIARAVENGLTAQGQSRVLNFYNV